ncbi:ydjO [Escherichia coli]|nr:ydjO [Escherichia coli]
MMSLWDALRMNMMISYQELVRTFLNTFLYSGLAKNGLKRSSVRLLAISENKRIGHYSGAGQGNHAGGDTGCG